MKKRVLVCGLVLVAVACERPSGQEKAGPKVPPRDPASTRSGVAGDAGPGLPPAASAKARVREPAKRKPVEAEAVEGRPGFVVSPYTGEAVDVRGIMPGTVIDDPGAADGSGKQLRVPDDAVVVARPVPGKPGFVFSPFNNKIIDVGGIPPGTLVADPMYLAEEKMYFRAPDASDEAEAGDAGAEDP